MKKLQKKASYYVGFYLLFSALSFIRALATYMFIVPNAFAPGGIGGIASLLYNIVGQYDARLAETVFNPAVTIFVFNVPLLILALIKLNKQFFINTTIGVLQYSLFMALFSLCNFPVFRGMDYESGVMFLAALSGGVISGISLGGMLLMNGSMGGTDIIAKLVYLKNPMVNVAWHLFIFDSIVVVASGIMGLIGAQGDDSPTVFINVLSPILYSFITLYATSKTADVITTGLQSSVVFNIVTEKYQEISDMIVTKMHRGATVFQGEGVFTHQNRHVVVCVAKRKQVAQLKKEIKAIDPNVFMYITNAREVSGFGFRSGN